MLGRGPGLADLFGAAAIPNAPTQRAGVPPPESKSAPERGGPAT
jgi:hypothetical protein